jgi:hypothetical protein
MPSHPLEPTTVSADKSAPAAPLPTPSPVALAALAAPDTIPAPFVPEGRLAMLPPGDGASAALKEAEARSTPEGEVRPSYRLSGADGATAIREAVRTLRRAGLARFVRGVVVASSVVCVAALARVAVASASEPPSEVAHATRYFLHESDTVNTFRTVHGDTVDPALHAARSRRTGGRATASRARPAW